MGNRQSSTPGCGGCLLITVLILLAIGGWQAVGNFVTWLFYLAVAVPLVGAAAFFGFVYSMRKRAAAYERSQTASHNRFVHLLVNILVCIAKEDGRFTQSELRTMLDFFQNSLRYNQEQMYWVKQLIKEAKDRSQDLEQLLTEFRSSFAYEPRLILLELIYQIIYTTKPVLEQELELARRIAAFLQISAYERQTIENKYRHGHHASGASPATPASQELRYRTVLGVEENADFAAIKKAYRQLSMQYHPDKVAHLGAEFKRVAEEKMKEINAAYDYFRKKFERA
ncbi:DnaJ domain-containing protein [Candidatus Electronema sp. JC]|uniref:DnaJ domain-containing protein n=1 Tax=Candidatus Electronema sp. JC TaxID=3401570 RepID=UPI003B428230